MGPLAPAAPREATRYWEPGPQDWGRKTGRMAAPSEETIPTAARALTSAPSGAVGPKIEANEKSTVRGGGDDPDHTGRAHVHAGGGRGAGAVVVAAGRPPQHPTPGRSCAAPGSRRWPRSPSRIWATVEESPKPACPPSFCTRLSGRVRFCQAQVEGLARVGQALGAGQGGEVHADLHRPVALVEVRDLDAEGGHAEQHHAEDGEQDRRRTSVTGPPGGEHPVAQPGVHGQPPTTLPRALGAGHGRLRADVGGQGHEPDR